MLNVRRGAALYVGALIGPGLLLVPALAVRAAGPASIFAWIGLIVLSAPLAITFSALGVGHPVAGGVSAYVADAFSETWAGVTGVWFLTAVTIGAPAVALIGGFYVADLTGTGTATADVTAACIYVAVLGTNLVGVQVSSRVQLGLSAVLVAIIAVAVIATVPAHAGQHWSPFAPHGWWAIGTAANILIWLFVGWEAMAQFAGDFAEPARDLPRAVGLAYAVIAVGYAGLAVATIVTATGGRSRVPLADLMSVGFGAPGRDVTVLLAVVLTMGTMNVYIGSAAKLAAALAEARTLPAWFSNRGGASIPRRPLLALSITGAGLLAGLGAGALNADDLVRATSACFVAVYVFALAAGVRLLDGRARRCATVALGLICVVAVFSGIYLLVPALAGVVAVTLRRARPHAALR